MTNSKSGKTETNIHHVTRVELNKKHYTKEEDEYGPRDVLELYIYTEGDSETRATTMLTLYIPKAGSVDLRVNNKEEEND